jgi:hypothetical protein
MDQSSSWETEIARQKITFCLENSKIYYRVHDSPTLDPVLSQ